MEVSESQLAYLSRLIIRQWVPVNRVESIAARCGVSMLAMAARSTVGGAAIGTAVGAAAGAALGAAAGNPAVGAAAGAGVGLLGGTVAGATAGSDASSTAQRRFDMTYMQCMYARGNQIPVARGALPTSYSAAPRQSPSVNVPPPAGAPPPPPPPAGAPPPPPPPPPAAPK